MAGKAKIQVQTFDPEEKGAKASAWATHVDQCKNAGDWNNQVAAAAALIAMKGNF